MGESDITDFELVIAQGAGFIEYALHCDESLYGTPKGAHDIIALAKTRNSYANGSPISLTGLCTMDTTSGILKDKVEITNVAIGVKLDNKISFNKDSQIKWLIAGQSKGLTLHELNDPLEFANDQTVAFNIVISFE